MRRDSLVLSALAVVLCGAAQLCAKPPVEQETEQEVAALIKQLGSGHTAQRDAAVKRLTKIGLPAVPQLERAVAHELQVISRRAKAALANIARRNSAMGLKAFLEGDADASLPGWEKCKTVLGDTPTARQIYLKMYRQAPKLLAEYEHNATWAVSQWETRCLPVDKVFDIDASRFSLGSAAVALLLAGDPQADNSYEAIAKLSNLLGAELTGFEKTEKTSFGAALAKKQYSAPLKNLANRWLRRPLDRPDNQVAICTPLAILQADAAFRRFAVLGKLAFAMRHNLQDGITFANHILKLPTEDKDTAIEQAAALLAIGRLGQAGQIKTLEGFLDNKSVCGQVILVDGSVDIQLRDVALASLIDLTGQELKDYPFANIPRGGGHIDLYRLQLVVCFDAEKTRERALAQWRAWSQKNLADAPAGAE